MEKGVVAVLILLTAFLLAIIFYIPGDSGSIFTQNESEFTSGTEYVPAGQNISTGSVVQTESYDNQTGYISPGGMDEFFSDIASGARGYGEYVQYDEDEMQTLSEGDGRNDISLSVGRTKTMNRMHLKDLYSGHEYEISPPEEFKFLLVSVTAAPISAHLERHATPATGDFIVVDPSGNITPSLDFAEGLGAVIKNDVSQDTMINDRFVIRGVGEIYVGKEVFSSLNAVEGSGALTGWIIYDVPVNYSVSPDTYLELELGGEKVYWRLHDIQVDVQVRKNYDSGRITVIYNGGPESYFIRAIEAKLVKADGSASEKYIEADENEESLPKTEFFLSGTPGEQDLLLIKMISSDGDEFVKYQKKI
jgi:hypothetical protein